MQDLLWQCVRYSSSLHESVQQFLHEFVIVTTSRSVQQFFRRIFFLRTKKLYALPMAACANTIETMVKNINYNRTKNCTCCPRQLFDASLKHLFSKSHWLCKQIVDIAHSSLWRLPNFHAVSLRRNGDNAGVIF